MKNQLKLFQICEILLLKFQIISFHFSIKSFLHIDFESVSFQMSEKPIIANYLLIAVFAV